MHGEAFAWLRATLSWPAPEGLAMTKWPAGAPLALAGGAVTLGRAADAPGFSFDNEQPAVERALRAVRDRRRAGVERRVPRLRRLRRLRPAGLLAR